MFKKLLKKWGEKLKKDHYSNFYKIYKKWTVHAIEILKERKWSSLTNKII